MSLKRIALSAAIILMSLVSCETLFPDRTAPTTAEVFDELWNAVDLKYVCFSNRDVDWDAVYTKYRGRIRDDASEKELFSVLSQMLEELKDRHISLSMDGEKWSGYYQEDPAINVVDVIVSQYLGKDKKESGGLHYNIIHNGMVGYVMYASFEERISDEHVNEMLDFFRECQGLILDLRGNSGGSSENLMTLLKYLPIETELYQTFIRHNNIRDDLVQQGVMLKPSTKDKSKMWQKPFIVLTDNNSFSASSIFAICIKGCEKMSVVGVKTAGGTCFPDIFELSNGWLYRIPTIKIITRAGIDFEDGVLPDFELYLDIEMAVEEKKDNIIESACEMILSR